MPPDPSLEGPGEPPDREPGDRETAEAAAWRAIVENFGERAVLDDAAEAPAPSPAASEPAVAEPAGEEEVEHFVPPSPPPLPTPPPERLLAWIGLFGVPVVVLVAVVLGLAFPSWLSILLLAWFVGGFVFLVATMHPRTDDPDDGAVV